jgi:hypothetical protein
VNPFAVSLGHSHCITGSADAAQAAMEAQMSSDDEKSKGKAKKKR